MTDDNEWGPWIEHDGMRRPVKDAFIEIEFRCGDIWVGHLGGADEVRTSGGVVARPETDESSSWVWGTHAPKWDVIRYRIRKPRGMAVLQEVVASPERELETT